MKNQMHRSTIFIVIALAFLLGACGVKATYVPQYDRSEHPEFDVDVAIAGQGVMLRVFAAKGTLTVGCSASRLVSKRLAIAPESRENPGQLDCVGQQQSVPEGQSTFLVFRIVDPSSGEVSLKDQREGRGYPSHVEFSLPLLKDGVWTTVVLKFKKRTEMDTHFHI